MFVFSLSYQQLTFSLLVTARDVYVVIAPLSVAFYLYMSRMRFTHAKAFEIPAANKCYSACTCACANFFTVHNLI